MRRILMALGFALLLPAVAVASATIDDLLGFERQATVKLSVGESHGSGVIISSDTILTAKHVAVEGPAFNVTLSDGTVVTGMVSWVSPDPKADLATVVFNKPAGVRPASVSCAPLKTGQPVVVVGWPLMLKLSAAFGRILSAEPIAVSGDKIVVPTDALMAPGNSGGPVFDANGRVIGVVRGGIPPYGLNLFVPVTLDHELCK